MSAALNSFTPANVVEAELNFIIPNGQRPQMFKPAPGQTEGRRTGDFEVRTVPIADGRLLAEHFSLDREGFELSRHATAVSDFLDDDEVRSIYYPEVERLVRDATGASQVVIFDHTVRIDDVQKSLANDTHTPVRTVHNDYTLKSGPQRITDLLDPEEARRWRAHRYALVNVWRSIAGPVETTPLAIADARSIRPESFVATDLVYSDRVGEIYNVAYDPNLRWHYFSSMTRDEALLLKVFDSADDGAKWTAHGAFVNPQAPTDAAPRESIEVRTLLSFAP